VAYNDPMAVVVIMPGTPDERVVPVRDRLFVGRLLLGIDDEHRLLLDDETVSRDHLEIHVDAEVDEATVVDRSTNGTRLNGVRIERAEPVALRPGDRLTVGEHQLEFRSDRLFGGGGGTGRRTTPRVSNPTMALVVGDIVGYSTISQHEDSTVVLASLDSLYAGLRRLLAEHGGTLNSYAGDALFAVWEADPPPAAAPAGVEFALAASEHVDRVAPELALRSPDGGPIRMGWAVVLGPVAVSALTHSQVAVIGDTTNLAFRLSGLAARSDLPDVIVTEKVRDAVNDRYRWSGPFEVQTKGREGDVPVYGVSRPVDG
jgi:adenylate cyclase